MVTVELNPENELSELQRIIYDRNSGIRWIDGVNGASIQKLFVA